MQLKTDPYEQPGACPPGLSLLDAQEVRLLTEAGFMAAGLGDLARARRIFSGLALVRPGRAFHAVGLALAHMNIGRAADAVRLLADAQASDAAERETLEVWRGLALQMEGRSDESQRLLRRVAQQAAAGIDSDSRRLALRLLGEESASKFAFSNACPATAAGSTIDPFLKGEDAASPVPSEVDEAGTSKPNHRIMNPMR